MIKKHTSNGDCHKCLNCGQVTFTESHPSRRKKYCNNRCQSQFEVRNGLKGGSHLKAITKEELIRMYVDENKSCLTIAGIMGKSIRTVSRYLNAYGIEARPFSTKGILTKLGTFQSKETREKIRQAHLAKRPSRCKTSYGYIKILIDKSYILEHRYIMEQSLGRKLFSYEHVHHINGKKQDNRLENLVVLTSSEHAKTHYEEREQYYQPNS